jgi:hypothetical protein
MMDNSSQQAQQGAFARGVTANYPQSFAGIQIEADILQYPERRDGSKTQTASSERQANLLQG